MFLAENVSNYNLTIIFPLLYPVREVQYLSP